MNITFIGGGNMAAALIGGMLQEGFLASQIQVVEISAENRERIKREFDIEAVPALDACVIGNDVIILAVKPQQLTELAQKVRSFQVLMPMMCILNIFHLL